MKKHLTLLALLLTALFWGACKNKQAQPENATMPESSETLTDSVHCVELGGGIGYCIQCTYPGKTMQQVHDIVRRDEKLLQDELPDENTEYTIAEDDEDVTVNYFIINNKHMTIFLLYEAGTTQIDLVETPDGTVCTTTYAD